jgi:BASS family bile acid:Na+ symporter
VVTAKLGGNLEEMTTYTFVSNFISALLIPLCFPLLPQATSASQHMEFLPLFLQMFWKVSTVLLLPMALALFTKLCLKRFHQWLVNVKDLSYYMWGCSLVIVSGTTAMNIVEAWERPYVFFLVAIAFLSLLLCIVQ